MQNRSLPGQGVDAEHAGHALRQQIFGTYVEQCPHLKHTGNLMQSLIL